MKKYLGLALCAGVAVLSQSCGSGDGAKKTRVVFDAGSGAEAGEDTGGTASARGGSSGAGGSTTHGGTGSGATGGGTVNGGTGGSSTGAVGGDSGASSSSAGEGGAPSASCATGTADCDTDPSTCETDLTRVTSCGSCTTSCNGTNDTVACQNMKCTITSCNTGFGDCDKDASTGCEQSLNANDNCGTCGKSCAAYGSTCSTGLCTPLVVNPKLTIGHDNGGMNNWAISGANIYEAGYAFPYTITRIPIDGSATSVVWTNASHYIGNQSLLATATQIFWAERGTPTSTVYVKGLTDAPATNPTIAFTPQYQPTYLRIQGNAFFWMSGDYQAGEPSYVYTRAVTAPATDPGTQIVSVTQGTHGAVVAFQAATDALYWVTSTAGTGTAYEIRTTPLAGGTPTAVPAIVGAAGGTAITDAGAPSIVQLRTLGKTLYFNYYFNGSSRNGIYSYNVGDAAPTNVVLDNDVQSFEVDATGVYYTGPGDQGVYKVALPGGVAGAKISTETFYGATGSSGGIATMDSTFVYTFGIPLGGASVCCSSELYKLIK